MKPYGSGGDAGGGGDSGSRLPAPAKPAVSGRVSKGQLMGWEPAAGLAPGWMQVLIRRVPVGSHTEGPQ